jgi:hypothetical protein
MFAYWEVVYFGQFLDKFKSRANFWDNFSSVMYYFCQDTGLTAFWATFSHLGPMLRFLNIFAEKYSEKIGDFVLKESQIFKKVDHNIGF